MGVDVTAIVTGIEALYATGGPIPLVGAAVLFVGFAIKAWKWVRRAG